MLRQEADARMDRDVLKYLASAAECRAALKLLVRRDVATNVPGTAEPGLSSSSAGLTAARAVPVRVFEPLAALT